MTRTAPTFRSGPIFDVIRYRAMVGNLDAHALSGPGEAPEVWTVTRTAPSGRTRTERVTLGELRHGGFARDCRALASIIKAGLAGRL